MTVALFSRHFESLLRTVLESVRESARERGLPRFLALLLVGHSPLVVSVAADDQYTFTRLEGPDKEFFSPLAINAKGQIVGDLYRADPQGDPIQAALRDVDGRFTTI